MADDDRKTLQAGEPARYQRITETLAKDLKARAVLLIVIEGRHGSGMAVSTSTEGVELGTPAGVRLMLQSTIESLELEGEGAVGGVAFTRFEPRGEA